MITKPLVLVADDEPRITKLVSIALHEVEDPSPFGVVVLDGDERITRFVEKPPRETAPSRLINAGTWLFEPSVVREMDAITMNRVEDVLFPALAGIDRYEDIHAGSLETDGDRSHPPDPPA